MSMKPKIILTEEVTTQIQEYEIKRDQLVNARTEIEDRFNTIQQVIQENATLETKARKLIEDFVALDEIEQGKRKEYFPEIRLGILQKIVEFVGVPPPPAGAAPAASGGENPPATDGSNAVSASAGETTTTDTANSGDSSTSGGDAPPTA